jgi:hypothetical protein
VLAVAVDRTYRMNQALAPNVGIDRPGGLSDQSLLHVPVFDMQHLDFSPSSLSMTPICRPLFFTSLSCLYSMYVSRE